MIIMRIRRFLAIAWTLAILLLCWIPSSWLPVKETDEAGLDIPHMDKIVHASIFTVFTVLWLFALPARRNRFALVAVAGILLAIVTEIGQSIPIIERDGDIADGVADSVGVAAGLLGFAAITALLPRRQTTEVEGALDAHA